MSSGFTSRLFDAAGSRAQELIGGVLSVAGLANFALWTSVGDGSAAVGNLEGGHLSLAANDFGGYAGVHPAYIVAFVVGLAVIAHARQ